MIRIGFGYDVHKFSSELYKDGLIYLCGLKISHNKKVISNSDGDVALHALIDAMLGAIAENDIGYYFSPNDPKWQSYNSEYFLKFANSKLEEANYKINNIDLIIVCEEPKIIKHRLEMRQKIADTLSIEVSQVSVKGKTEEGLGFTGRKEGIAAYATIAISKTISKTE